MIETLIELHDQETAPESARPTLTAVNRANGFIPNMFRALANSPSTLNGFAAMLEANDGGTLSPMERQIVQLAASVENQGRYCVAGHSSFAARMGLPVEPITAIREGRPLPDKRYQGLADFTRAVVRNRGHVTAHDKAAFEASGFRIEQIFEVIAGIALKTITNYVGSVFDLPLDRQFQAQAWSVNGNHVAPREENAVASRPVRRISRKGRNSRPWWTGIKSPSPSMTPGEVAQATHWGRGWGGG